MINKETLWPALIGSLVIILLVFVWQGGLNSESGSTPYLGLMPDTGERGVKVLGTFNHGPAKEAGVRDGDEILTLDGVRVQTPKQLIDTLDGYKVGDRVKLEILRGDENIQIDLELTPFEGGGCG